MPTHSPVDLIERARRYVAKMPGAIAEQGGHNATFHVACVLVQGFGLAPDQAWPLFTEFNARCEPPWTDKELRHKLNGADKAGSKRGRGFLAKGAEWKPSQKWVGYHSLPEPARLNFDAAKLRTFSGRWAKEVDLVWLANRSALDPACVTAAQFLERLYEQGEKVAVFEQEHAVAIGAGITLWPDTPPPTQGPEPRPCGIWFLAQPVDGGYHRDRRGGEDELPESSGGDRLALLRDRVG